jgi:diaminopimelate decarboxylase
MSELNANKRRFYVQDVAEFVEAVLRHQLPEQREKWAALPQLIRQHRHPFFYVEPGRRIVDCIGVGLVEVTKASGRETVVD